MYPTNLNIVLLQSTDLAYLYFTFEGVFDLAPDVRGETETYAAIRADLTGNWNKLVGDVQLL